MSKTLKWILFVVLGLFVLVIVGGVLAAGIGGLRYGGYSMMRQGTWMGDQMRVGGYHSLGWIFGALLCCGILILIVVGIVALVAALTRRNHPIEPSAVTPVTAVAPAATPERPCPNCGRMTQEEWKTCPYCGTPLT